MNRSQLRRRARRPLGALALAAVMGGAACASTDPGAVRREAAATEETPETPGTGEGVESHAQALLSPAGQVGKKLFAGVIPKSNGRACTTCHVMDEDTTLRPASVTARLRANPQDPLFHRLDADDPDAATLSFAHLEKGLVRVVLPLPDNMDVIDIDGRVVTRPDRTIFVWRGVPTVANTAMTAPYQLDGREPDLQTQAQGAVTNHAEGPKIGPAPLDQVAAFQRELFTSPRAWLVARLLDLGVPLDKVPTPEDYVPLAAAERRGREVYKQACEACHGSATTDRIVNREVHDLFFAALGPDGNLRFDVVPGKGPVAVPEPRPHDEFLNIGFGFGSYLGQLGLLPAFNASVALPRYRFRFYTDGTRTRAVTDLPPVPVTVSGDIHDLRPALDERGAPIVGPNRRPQLFSTDPGRAAITGDPLDFEAFDVPQLRGIAGTAPYYHDNSTGTLEEVVDNYSRFVLGFITPLRLPAVHPPERPGGSKEALTPAQKADLLALLRRL
jgi:cytochrome c peroxidase